MNLTFRSAGFHDIEVIKTLASKIWREHYPSIISAEQIEFMLVDRYSIKAIEAGMTRGEKFFLAYKNEIPVAYASIELIEGYYYLHKFYLDVSMHRSGIGNKFFRFLVSQIDSGKTIRLQVNRQNFKAINFYFKAGFVIESIGDFDIGGGFFMNDFVMVRYA